MRPRPSRTRGFSLVELMVTTVILGVIMTAMFSVLFRSGNAEQYAANVAEVRSNARAAVQLIERDVRMAGSGWGRLPLNVDNNNTAEVWWALKPGPGGGSCDSIRMIGAWDSTTPLTSDMTGSTSTISVQSVAGFNVNDLAVVTDGSSAHMFQVTAVDAVTNQLLHGNTSPYNPVSTAFVWGWPSGGYAANKANVYRISAITYRMDSTSYRRPSLIRAELGRPPAVVMYDVRGFQVWYRPQGAPDTVLRVPSYGMNQVPLVDKIQPRVYTRAVANGRAAVLDSVWSEIQPRVL
jgi:prepilin-type N-terminal cleavage/methylation domain-containing protein